MQPKGQMCEFNLVGVRMSMHSSFRGRANDREQCHPSQRLSREVVQPSGTRSVRVFKAKLNEARTPGCSLVQCPCLLPCEYRHVRASEDVIWPAFELGLLPAGVPRDFHAPRLELMG